MFEYKGQMRVSSSLNIVVTTGDNIYANPLKRPKNDSDGGRGG